MCQLNKSKNLEGGNDEGSSCQSLNVPFSGARTALGMKTWSKALGEGRFAMKQHGWESFGLLLSL